MVVVGYVERSRVSASIVHIRRGREGYPPTNRQAAWVNTSSFRTAESFLNLCTDEWWKLLSRPSKYRHVPAFTSLATSRHCLHTPHMASRFSRAFPGASLLSTRYVATCFTTASGKCTSSAVRVCAGTGSASSSSAKCSAADPPLLASGILTP